MKILMLVPYPNIRGPLPKILPVLIREFKALGYTVFQNNWSAHSDNETFIQKVFGRPVDILRICFALLKHNVDIMVVTTTHDWKALLRDTPLLVFSRLLCKKIVLQFHGSYSNRLIEPGNSLMKKFTWLLLKLSDGVLLLSKEEIHEMKKFFPDGKYFFVDNPSIFEPENRKSIEDRNQEREPVILFTGRLVEEKGIYDLLEAALKLREKVAFKLIFTGDGPERKNLTEKGNQVGLSDCIEFTGYLNGKKLENVYQSADIFILPSWREGFPLVLIEAMGYGLPIVTTRIRGAVDRLVDGENAIFVNPKSPEEISEALYKLILDKQLRDRMTKANLEKVNDYKPRVVATKYLGILKEISTT